MAIYRPVQTSFWQDGFVMDMTPEEKYFYLYLLTNSKTSQCGIYELPYRIIENETGYNRETVEKLLNRFCDYGKIKYNKENKEIYVINWQKYNFSNSKNTLICINKELRKVKTHEFTEDYLSDYQNSDSYDESVFEVISEGLEGPYKPLAIPLEENKKKKKNNNKNNKEIYKESSEKNSELNESDSKKSIYREIINYLNEKTGKNYLPSTGKTIRLINSRLSEKFTLDDFKKVIDRKTEQWKDTDMNKFLRPDTLFSPKFEGYLNENEGGIKNGSENNRKNYGKNEKLEGIKNPSGERYKPKGESTAEHDRKLLRELYGSPKVSG